jgi:hypothetical protein
VQQGQPTPGQPASRTPPAGDARSAHAATDTIETVILRRAQRGAWHGTRSPGARSAGRWRRPPALSPAISCHRRRRCWSTSWLCTPWRGCRRGLPVERGRVAPAPSRGRARPHPLAVSGAGSRRRCDRDRLSLRAAGANPGGLGRTRLPGRPAGGRRRRRAAAPAHPRPRPWPACRPPPNGSATPASPTRHTATSGR